MATKFKVTIALVLVYVCTIFSTCRKGAGLLGGCPNSLYSFSIQAKAYPDKDSIHTGDTLWIEINSPTLLKDNITGNLINFDNAANLSNAFSIDIFTGGDFSNPGTTPKASNFDYVIADGKSVFNSFAERIREFEFVESNGNYHLKVGTIAKQKGIYTLAISNAANVYRKNEPCPKVSFEMIFFNTNQHLYYYQQNRPGYVISDYERTHMYCFKVY